MSDDSRYVDELAKLLFPRQATPEQIREMFEAVGTALSAWQLIENALYLLFERSIGPNRPGAAGCAFHTLQFAAKLAATDAAVKFALLAAPKKKRAILNAKWQTMHDKARDKSKARNAFAHFGSVSYVDEPKKDRRVRLEPHLYDFRYAAGLLDRREYTANDVKNHIDVFRRLAQQINAFVSHVPLPRQKARRPKRPPASS